MACKFFLHIRSAYFLRLVRFSLGALALFLSYTYNYVALLACLFLRYCSVSIQARRRSQRRQSKDARAGAKGQIANYAMKIANKTVAKNNANASKNAPKGKTVASKGAAKVAPKNEGKAVAGWSVSGVIVRLLANGINPIAWGVGSQISDAQCVRVSGQVEKIKSAKLSPMRGWLVVIGEAVRVFPISACSADKKTVEISELVETRVGGVAALTEYKGRASLDGLVYRTSKEDGSKDLHAKSFVCKTREEAAKAIGGLKVSKGRGANAAWHESK